MLSIFQIDYLGTTGAELRAVAIARDFEGARILLMLSHEEIVQWKIIGTAAPTESPREVACEEPQLFSPSGHLLPQKEPIQSSQPTRGQAPRG